MRLLLAALVLVFAPLSVPLAAPGDVTAVPDLTAGQRSRAFVERVTVIYRDTLGLLEREFPEDHAELMRELVRLGAARGDERARAIVAFDRIADVRRRHAQLLPEAPPAALSAILVHLAGFYEAVFAAEGPQVCARLARDGSAVLFELGLAPKYAPALDRQSYVFFEAVLLARNSPAERIEDAGQEDWAMVFAVMAGTGAPRAHMEALTSGDPAHLGICPALARLLRTASVLDTPEGLRTRADFAKNLAGY